MGLVWSGFRRGYFTFPCSAGFGNRGQLVADTEDIIAAFDALDAKDLIPPMFCDASDLFRLPPLSLDPVAEQVSLNSQSLDALSASVKALESKVSSLVCSIPLMGDKVSISGDTNSDSYVPRASSFLPPSTTSSGTKSSVRSSQASSPPKFEDRDLNLILFGLPESRSITELKKIVDEILEFLAKRPVQIKDLFHLGKRNPSPSSGTRPRPVLIKLCATWDRKVLLLSKRSLQQFRLKGLFLRADVPPEHRLRQGVSVKAKPKPCVQQSPSSLEPETCEQASALIFHQTSLQSMEVCTDIELSFYSNLTSLR